MILAVATYSRDFSNIFVRSNEFLHRSVWLRYIFGVTSFLRRYPFHRDDTFHIHLIPTYILLSRLERNLIVAFIPGSRKMIDRRLRTDNSHEVNLCQEWISLAHSFSNLSHHNFASFTFDSCILSIANTVSFAKTNTLPSWWNRQSSPLLSCSRLPS